MTLQVSFKNMDSSPALEEYARQKLTDVLQKFVMGDPNVQLTFQVDNLDHIAHCHLHLGKGRDVALDVTTESMYASVDKLVDKLQRQLRDEKSRKVDHKHGKSKFERAEEMEMTANSVQEEDKPEPIDAAVIVGQVKQQRS